MAAHPIKVNKEIADEAPVFRIRITLTSTKVQVYSRLSLLLPLCYYCRALRLYMN